MKRKILTLLCTLVSIMACGMSFHVSAEDNPTMTTTTITTTDPNDDIEASILIQTNSAYISAGTKKVLITSTTQGVETMAKIGVKDIKIERSSNGSSGWVQEKTDSDQLASNTYIHHLNSHSVSVTGGYYYRVTLTHYAKETGWFFPGSQSITTTTNVVWVPSN